MKKLFLLACFLLAAGLHAQDYKYLALQQADGTTVSLSLDKLKITFTDENLVATNAEGTQTFPLASLEAMAFALTDGVNAPLADADAALPADAVVYTLDGRRLRAAQMQSGVYVMRKDGRTQKILKR